MNYPELADPYMALGQGDVDVLVFQYRLCALIWLHRTTSAAIDTELARLAEMEETGSHRVPGWQGELDLVLSEVQGILNGEAAPVGAGTIIASCCSALESLLTDMLPTGSRRGLRPKAQAVANLLADREEADAIVEHDDWLAKQRNSFAHRLTDEGGHWDDDPNSQRYDFDDDTVEETFERCGEIATLLDKRYEEITRWREARP
ncbi:hypothetical protein IU459_34190 [Nocardia amamiensis]|uniref:Uncharacterized protein n=1 Tax=Nocardia amamiensis TaxID=404578 RepID=A0ABS0D159_9NOCA|nr:hypothetical protein [Nocardia amamiensis]MBF6302554.1 hypothetical protein [Nocardia amamiensis]